MKKIIAFIVLLIGLSRIFGQIININAPLNYANIDYYLALTETSNKTVYVSETSGNDISGDGTVSNPYQSILGAFAGLKTIIKAEIIIQLDSGAYNWGLNESIVASQLEINGYNFFVQGERYVIIEDLALTADDTVKTTYDAVKSGLTVTANELQGLFINQSASNVFPVTYNGAGTTNFRLEMAKSSKNTTKDVVQMASVVTVTDETALDFDCKLLNGGNFIFQDLKFQRTGSLTMQYSTNPKEFNNCHITTTTGFNIGSFAASFYTQLRLNQCYIECTAADDYAIALQRYLGNIEFVKSGIVTPNLTSPVVGAMLLDCYSTSNVIMNDVVLNSNGVGGAIKLGHTPVLQIRKTIAARDCPIFFWYEDQYKPESFKVYFTGNYLLGDIYMTNTPVLFYKSFEGMDITLNDIITNTGSYDLYESGRLTLKDPSRKINLTLNDYVYPEIEVDTFALTDNSTVYLNIGDSVYNKSITIEYTTTRSTSIEKNTVQIINKQSAVSVVEGTLAGDDIGLSFAVEYNAGIIRLACTLTSTGNNANFQYRVKRTMY